MGIPIDHSIPQNDSFENTAQFERVTRVVSSHLWRRKPAEYKCCVLIFYL